MKTRNNQLVALAIFTFLLFVGNVYAKGTELSASSHENIEEKALIIENWMLIENNWNTNNFAYELKVELDNELKVENWMTEDSNWNSLINYDFMSETDNEEIQLEDWMTNNLVWMVPDAVETEEKLAVENWMQSEYFWLK